MSKILYISNARIPTEKAHGIHIMKMCEAFASAAEFELVIPPRFNKIKEDPFKYYGIKRNFKIKKIPCIDLIPWDKYFKYFGLGYLPLWLESFTFSLSVFFYLLFKKADIIYARDKSLLFISSFWRNFIFEAHTFPKNYFLYAIFLKRLKGLVVITHKLKGLFAERGMEPDKILVAPDGVDLKQFDIKDVKEECRKKLNLPFDKKIVLYSGHLYAWKGAQILAEASKYLRNDVEIYFVGGTAEDIQKFKIQIDGYPISIKIVGHRPHSEIPFWLKAADVLVLPNSGKEEISKHWTSPLKMFEYMASGGPIVASDLPSIREILNEENAILVEPDNPSALAQGIKDVLNNHSLSDKISRKAFLDVQQYTWKKRVEKICQKLINT